MAPIYGMTLAHAVISKGLLGFGFIDVLAGRFSGLLANSNMMIDKCSWLLSDNPFCTGLPNSSPDVWQNSPRRILSQQSEDNLDAGLASKLLGAPGLTTRSKDATRGSWHRY